MAMLRTCTPPTAHSGQAFSPHGAGIVRWNDGGDGWRLYFIHKHVVPVKELTRMGIVRNAQNP